MTAEELHRAIKQYRLDWRHPELKRILKRIEHGSLHDFQIKRWFRKIKPWIEEQQKCLNPFGPAPSTQDEIGNFDVEAGHCIENPSVRVGIRILDKAGRSVIAAGCTGSGKSNLIRKLIYGIDSINRNSSGLHNHPSA